MPFMDDLVREIARIGLALDDKDEPETAPGGAPVGGAGAAGQVTYWTGVNTVAGDAGMTYAAGTDTLTVGNVNLPDGGFVGVTASNGWTFNAGTDITTTGAVLIDLGADVVGLTIQATAGHSVNLVELQDNAANVLSGADERGILFSDGDSEDNNFFAGKNAGNIASTGTGGNIGIGQDTLKNVSTGYQSVAIGDFAMGIGIVTGYRDVALGPYALYRNTSGYGCFAAGYLALGANTSGHENFAMGNRSCERNTIGNNLVAIGAQTLRYNIDGSQTVAIGQLAGMGVVGNSHSFNTFVGSRSGAGVTTGSGGLYLGFDAGFSLTSGDGNVLIGPYAGRTQVTVQDNLLYIANTDTATPLVYGEFDGAGNIGLMTYVPAAAAIGFTIRGAAAQAANLQEWQKNDATILAYVDEDGVGGFTAVSLATTATFTGATGINEIIVPDNFADALSIEDAGGLDYVQIVSTNANPYFNIFPAGGGNVGVGTANPSELIEAERNQNATTAISVVNTDVTNATSRAAIKAKAGTIESHMISIVTSGTWIGSASNHNLYLMANGSAKMVIEPSGNVGLNELTPGAQFHTQTSGAAVIGQVIRGTAAQSANLFELQESDGSIMLASGDGLGGSVFSGNQQLEDIDFVWAGDTEANLFRVDAALDQVRLGDWDTNYLITDKLGDSWWVGGGGLPYGEIHAHNVASDLALAAQDTWYQIVAFDSDGRSNKTTPAHGTDDITIIVDGDYLVTLSWSGHSHAANDYQIMVKVNNGTADCANVTIHETTAVAGRVQSSAVAGYCNFSAADTVEVWAMRTDGAAVAKTLTTDHITLTVTQVGGGI